MISEILLCRLYALVKEHVAHIETSEKQVRNFCRGMALPLQDANWMLIGCVCCYCNFSIVTDFGAREAAVA